LAAVVFVSLYVAECMDNVMINVGVPNGMLRIITNLPSGLQRCLKAVYIKEMNFANKHGFRSEWKKAY
jgi:hypothetical protein